MYRMPSGTVLNAAHLIKGINGSKQHIPSDEGSVLHSVWGMRKHKFKRKSDLKAVNLHLLCKHVCASPVLESYFFFSNKISAWLFLLSCSVLVCHEIKKHLSALSVIVNEMWFPGGKSFSQSQISYIKWCYCRLMFHQLFRWNVAQQINFDLSNYICRSWVFDVYIYSLFLIKLQIVPQRGKSNCYCHAVDIQPPPAKMSPRPTDRVPKVFDVWGCYYTSSNSKSSLFPFREKQNHATWQPLPVLTFYQFTFTIPKQRICWMKDNFKTNLT